MDGYILNNVLYYAYTDHLGHPEVITDQNQTTVWRTHLFAYQSSAYFDTFGGLHIGFPGQNYDYESDLWYNWYRYYDASTGRYLQSDPIGLGGGRNTYAYVGGNPISLTDYLGLFKICQRPLSFAGNYMSSGVTGSNLGIFHEHGFYEDGSGANTGFTTNGLFDDSNNGEKYQRCNEKRYNDEIIRQAEKNISSNWQQGYNLITKNCQDYIDALIKEHNKLLNTPVCRQTRKGYQCK